MTAECIATITSAFHSLAAAHCALPSGSDSRPPLLALSGSFDDIRHPAPALLMADLPATSAANLVDLIKTLSTHTPPGLTLGGVLSGSMTWKLLATDAAQFEGSLLLKGGTLQADPESKTPIVVGDAVLRPANAPAPPPPTGSARARTARAPLPDISPTPDANTLLLLPSTLTLGAHEPAILDGRFSSSGYTLHLTGNATPERLAALAAALPQFAKGLPIPPVKPAGPNPPPPAPIHLDLVSTTPWGGDPAWSVAAPVPQPPAPRRRPRR